MRKLNDTVQYDFQRNTFYKINKETGAESPSYKNGQPVKKFRPDVTGRHYLIRRKSERQELPDETKLLIKQRSFNTERIAPEFSYYKTLETSRRDSKVSEAASVLMRTTNSKKKEVGAAESRENSFVRVRDGEQEEPSRQKSQQKASKMLLNQTLTNYAKLLKEKSRQNNSPKRDKYPGSETARDPLETLCTTLSHFKIKEPIWDSQLLPAIPTPRESRHSQLPSKKEMSSKERSMFLEFHPEYKNTVNPAQLEVQVQRKRNLKILEDLFIRVGNRQTRKAYHTPS